MREAINPPLVTLEDVLVVANLNAAWAKVKANAGAAGVDGLTVTQSREVIYLHPLDQELAQRGLSFVR